MVEYLVHNLKVQPVLKYFSITPPENLKTQPKIQAHMPEFFFLYVRIESAAPGLGSRNQRRGL
jgi:hypothetical protein